MKDNLGADYRLTNSHQKSTSCESDQTLGLIELRHPFLYENLGRKSRHNEGDARVAKYIRRKGAITWFSNLSSSQLVPERPVSDDILGSQVAMTSIEIASISDALC